MKKTQSLTIGVLAKSANVGVETIRFYERKGILQQPEKVNGYRQYSHNDVRIVRLVKKLQGVGFTLEEIKEFLVFDHCCAQSREVVKHKSSTKILEIKQQIAELQATVKALESFSTACGSATNSSLECALLDCFENDWKCCSPSE